MSWESAKRDIGLYARRREVGGFGTGSSKPTRFPNQPEPGVCLEALRAQES